MDTQLIVFMATIGVVLAVVNAMILFVIRRRRRNEIKKIREAQPKKIFTPTSRSLEELLGVLDFTIEKEIMFRLKIELELKRSTKIITAFDEELNTLSKSVIGALGEGYMNELNHYYTTDYILRYTVKTIQIYLIKYMDENKPTTK